MFYLRSKISLFLLAVANLRSKTFKIITRYFALIFGCKILKFTDYLNLLQNTADLSTMTWLFISLNLVLLPLCKKAKNLFSLASFA